MSSASFQILSDLHLETHTSYAFTFKQTAPNLALLGDIGHVADDALFDFLKRQLRRYWNVFFLFGNHEPVGTSWPLAKQRVRAFAERMEHLRSHSTIGRFVFLDQTRYDVNDTVTVLGCTLFTRVAQEQAADVASRLVDFRQIQGWSVGDHVAAHESDLRWLNEQVGEISRTQPQRQVVIFTHHSPTRDVRAVEARHMGSSVSSGFGTDLSGEECWTSPSVVLWSFGHTHFNCDFHDGLGKRVVTNQKGSALFLEDTFDVEKVVVVGRQEGSML